MILKKLVLQLDCKAKRMILLTKNDVVVLLAELLASLTIYQ